MELRLTEEERELLMEVLGQHQRELLREISRTHHHEFKVTLKKNERLLESLLSRLEADPVHA
jgi:hypothetical protein